jgi:glutamine cyclotransferase
MKGSGSDMSQGQPSGTRPARAGAKPRTRILAAAVAVALALAVVATFLVIRQHACLRHAGRAASGNDQGPTRPAARYTARVVRTYPHDPAAFTQGLVFKDGSLYESTGMRRQSTLREVALETGTVLRSHALPDACFGEGITIRDGLVFQLTWESNTGFVYRQGDFALLRTFRYPGEGWGLTHDASRLIMSDGTSQLRFLDPVTLEETGRVRVRDANGPVVRLNELEYVRGTVFANVWLTDRIAMIDPETGHVTGWIDLSGLLEDRSGAGVLNGIAFDASTGRLFVTGKRWPLLFEIELVPAPGSAPRGNQEGDMPREHI